MILACHDAIETVSTQIAGFSEVLRSDNFIAISAIALGGVIAIAWIIGGTIDSVAKARAREQTKRELAAYVAEGTLDPDKAVAIINAGRVRPDRTCAES
jgi:hypothetical protein